MKKHFSKIQLKNQLIGYSFFLPWLIGFVAITLYPVIFSICMSFSAVSITTHGIVLDWEGLKYYNDAWNIDANFKINLTAAMTFILGLTPIVLVFSLIFAMFLNQNFRGRFIYRTIFFFPVVIMSGPVVSNLLLNNSLDFSESAPSIYIFLRSLPSVLRKPCLFVLDNIELCFWMLGVQLLIYLVGLQKVGDDIYEAASIDGAGSWEKFWKITLPNLKAFILLNAIYTVMELSNYSESAINQQIKNSVFWPTKVYSFASALSWIYFLCIIAVMLIVYLLYVIFARR